MLTNSLYTTNWSLKDSYFICNHTIVSYFYNSCFTGDATVDYYGNQMNGMMFTTRDRDNDINLTDNCAFSKKSGWWHAACTYANLNGGVYTAQFVQEAIYWRTWKLKGLKGTRIMIKPKP